MAKVLNTYEFTGRGGGVKYSWDQWFDGRIWRLTADDVGHANLGKFRNTAAAAARHRGGHLQTNVKEDAVIIQFIAKADT